MGSERLDLVIVGAGWHGLAIAKAFSEVNPSATFNIIDTAESLGGTWAKERLYPGLKTNNLLGSYEFGDFPMEPARFGVLPGQHIPGAVVHEYLRQFAEEFNLSPRLRLRTAVVSAELLAGGEWLLQLAEAKTDSHVPLRIQAKKLVIATGLTSRPYIPDFPGHQDFQGNYFHSINLKDRAKDIEMAKEVVVLGANKSAWDTCYSAAVAGAQVHMVVRPSGGGPSWVWPVTFTPLRLSIQRLATTRLFSLFEPCIWAGDSSGFSWLRYLLHQTWLGRRVVAAFWNLLGSLVHRANGYDDHPELRKLKPWSSTFWMGNSLGIHNYAQNWFDLVRGGRIRVHVADVASLSGQGVHLSNGAIIDADNFICCTGWEIKPSIKFIPETLAHDLGLPCELGAADDVATQEASIQILRSAPSLSSGPSKVLPPGSAAHIRTQETKKSPLTRSNYQLYRFMVPPGERYLQHRNIAFIGAHLALNAITVAQAQALWITAFFNGEIESLRPQRLDLGDVHYQTILHAEYTRLRHPPEGSGAGHRCPDLCFDGLMYTDLLLKDLGIKVYRKGGIWKELFHRYLPSDYRGLVGEWKRQRKP